HDTGRPAGRAFPRPRGDALAGAARRLDRACRARHAPQRHLGPGGAAAPSRRRPRPRPDAALAGQSARLLGACRRRRYRSAADGRPRLGVGRSAAAARGLRDGGAGAPLWGVKDPRLCRLLPLWRPLLAGLGARPCFILAVRHPAEVAGSLLRRDGLNAGCAAILWLRHVLEAERGSRGAARAIVHYEDLVGGAGWRAVAARLAAQFGIAWPRTGAAAEAAVDSY